MQVNVFISEVQPDGEPAAVLVLPYGPVAAIPTHLQDVVWRYFATTEADDKIIGLGREGVEAAIASDGYVLTVPAER